MFILTPPILYSTYQLIKGDKTKTSLDERSTLDLYKNFEWSDKHFVEVAELSTTYYDFITWRRNDYAGETININNGLRVTSKPDKLNGKTLNYFFFGGSTTWGTGVDDKNTYPSIFSKLTRSHVTNFGESGYIARQSLAYLNNHVINYSLLDMSNVSVVFYDGVNDVNYRCRNEFNGMGTGRENQIQNLLKSEKRFSFMRTFNQMKDFINLIFQKYIHKDTSNLYSCASKKKRALTVAKSLVDTWEITADFVESRGGKFTAILQPVAYYGNADTSYLNLTSNDEKKSLAAQYQAVYPIIIELANERNFNFIDLTGVYDGCNECYIDFNHVGPQGHEILVSKLISYL
ncbi:conserved hypothetical protein [Candidatus Pelagibacter sp. HTCC7211]|nr:conserved hypothetical protein [Candidatus Pelagibacter sp. HTCC7211]MBD1151422.1 SGNH/GDSL hydrolase family protein [Pelagibacterales bacterium SAG-MED25]